MPRWPQNSEDPGVRESRVARPERVPFGGMTYKLEVKNKDPNYYYYWFRNRQDELKRAEAAGYDYVTPRMQRLGELTEEVTNRDVDGGNQSVEGRTERYGGRDEFGREYVMVLMRQPMEYHLQDLAADQKAADAIDEAITRQEFDGKNIAQKYGSINVTHKAGA